MPSVTRKRFDKQILDDTSHQISSTNNEKDDILPRKKFDNNHINHRLEMDRFRSPIEDGNT